MAEELEVSLRTLYRDVADLAADGVPIRGEAGIGYVLGEGYDLPPLMFNADELEAVMLGLRWVMRRGDDDLKRAALDSVAKVGAVLPQELRPTLYDAGLLVPPNQRSVEDRVDLSVLRRAIRDQRKVEIRYVAEDGAQTQRMIWPIALAYLEAQRLVIAWCELRADFRTFRTDRIQHAEARKDKYPERRKVLLKRWTEQEEVAGHRPQFDVLN